VGGGCKGGNQGLGTSEQGQRQAISNPGLRQGGRRWRAEFIVEAKASTYLQAKTRPGRSRLELGGGVPVGEDNFGEGLAGAGAGLLLFEVGGEGVGIAEVADGGDGSDVEVFRDAEGGAGFIVAESGHGVGVEAEGSGLDGEGRRGGAGVVKAVIVRGAVVGEGLLAGGEDEDGSGFGPILIEGDEGVVDLFVGRVTAAADDEAPGLLIEGGGGPVGGFEQGGEVGGGDIFVGEGAGRPAFADDFVEIAGGGGLLGGFDLLGCCHGLW
jgi:hypothetical protein